MIITEKPCIRHKLIGSAAAMVTVVHGVYIYFCWILLHYLARVRQGGEMPPPPLKFSPEVIFFSTLARL